MPRPQPIRTAQAQTASSFLNSLEAGPKGLHSATALLHPELRRNQKVLAILRSTPPATPLRQLRFEGPVDPPRLLRGVYKAHIACYTHTRRNASGSVTYIHVVLAPHASRWMVVDFRYSAEPYRECALHLQ